MKKREKRIGSIFAISVACVIFSIGILSWYKIYTFEPTMPEIGSKFLYSNNWNNKNPFEETIIDTIVILDIKESYIKWRFIGSDKYYSTSSRDLSKLVKEIK